MLQAFRATQRKRDWIQCSKIKLRKKKFLKETKNPIQRKSKEKSNKKRRRVPNKKE